MDTKTYMSVDEDVPEALRTETIRLFIALHTRQFFL